MECMKIIDNYVSEFESTRIREVLTSNTFPWNYCDKVVTTQDNDRHQFTHVFYFEGEPQSRYYHDLLLREFLTNLDACALIKVKANLQIKTAAHHEDSALHLVSWSGMRETDTAQRQSGAAR